MKRMITLILAVAMLASALSIPAFAAYAKNGFYGGKEWNARCSYTSTTVSSSMSYEGKHSLYVDIVAVVLGEDGPKLDTRVGEGQKIVRAEGSWRKMNSFISNFYVNSNRVWRINREISR